VKRLIHKYWTTHDYPSAVALGAAQPRKASNVLKLLAALAAQINNAHLGQVFENNF
jgi:hypothetical protein